MSNILGRRQFVARVWKAGGVLVAAAGSLTMWDLLQPLPTTGFGGKVRSLLPDSITESAIVEVPAARSYLTRVDDEIVALSRKCTHLGCVVPYCESSGRFECPCHGSVFNRAGDFLSGPSPRGMDRFETEVGDDGLVYIDTSERIDGPPPGPVTVDEPALGPKCTSEGGHG
ncbi:MAG: ubiquinol-cytochrome c reductase iron-sulfur subunit [Actinomycetia bacterium]|nr:ubiquinol-cytochrome c reductase iron-sulfur subunit [Actinomycetes bacterium]